MRSGKKLLSLALCAALSASVMAFPAAAEELPSKYDLRDEKILSEVRNQGMVGSCWAFSSIGILENWLRKNDMGDYDLSERHMDLVTANAYMDAINFDHGTSTRQYGLGGNNMHVLTYFYSGKGPVYESACKYVPSYEGGYSLPERESECRTAGITVKDVGIGKCYGDLTANSISKNNEMILDMKKAITDHGGVSVSYNAETDETDFYSTTFDAPNHAVMIVGWDDSYPKEKLVSSMGFLPEKDGAWIVRNSWGKETGEDGYFYMSYETPSLYRTSYIYIERAAKTDHDMIYCSSPIAATAFDTSSSDTDNNTDYSLNVFDVNPGKQSINAVTGAFRADSDFEVYVIDNYSGITDSSKGKLVAQGSTDHDCYKTFDFDPIELTGDKFAVRIKYTSKDGTAALIPVQNNIYSMKGFFGDHDFSGISFISHDGVKWTDTSKKKDEVVFVRAYTVNNGDTHKVTFGSELGYQTAKLYTKDGREVYKNPDGSFNVEDGTYDYVINQAGFETVKGKVKVNGNDSYTKVEMRYAPTIADLNTELGIKDPGDYEIAYMYGLNNEEPLKVRSVKIGGKKVDFTQNDEVITVTRDQLSFLKKGEKTDIVVTYSNKAKASVTVDVTDYTDEGKADLIAARVMKEMSKVSFNDVQSVNDIADKLEKLGKKFSKKAVVTLNGSTARFVAPDAENEGSYAFDVIVIYGGRVRSVSVSGKIAPVGSAVSKPVMNGVYGWSGIINDESFRNAAENGGELTVTLDSEGKVPAVLWQNAGKAVITFNSYDGSYSWKIDCSQVENAHEIDLTVNKGHKDGVFSDGTVNDYYSSRIAGGMYFYTDESFDIKGDLTFDLKKYFSGFTGEVIYKDLLFKYDENNVLDLEDINRVVISQHSGKTALENIGGGSYALMLTTDAYIYGDVDMNTEGPDTNDVKTLSMYITLGMPGQIRDLNPFAYAMMDINEDGTVDNSDVEALRDYVKEVEKKKQEDSKK